LQATRQFEEAVKPAEELLALRQRRQGAAHWQTADGRRERETIRKIAAMPEAAQRDIVAAGKLHEEALALERKNRYVEAEAPLQKALAIHRKYLGEEPSCVKMLSDGKPVVPMDYAALKRLCLSRIIGMGTTNDRRLRGTECGRDRPGTFPEA
jgi:hypothetical protein